METALHGCKGNNEWVNNTGHGSNPYGWGTIGVMSKEYHWLETAKSELDMAESARVLGNEGMARVCSRRAAGIALGEFFRRRGEVDPGPSAIDRINQLLQTSDIDIDNKERAYRLTVRVNEDHQLPGDHDLIAETRDLIHGLLDAEV